MKKNLPLLLVLLGYFSVYFINSCKKNKDEINNGSTGISASFTEEFRSVYDLTNTSKWVSNIGVGPGWYQGTVASVSKANGAAYGFPAYSSTATPDEYVGSFTDFAYNGISSWLITPVLSVKNGDKISFYSRADTGTTYTDRLQVRANKSTSQEMPGTLIGSVGGYTTVLIDINPSQTTSVYPTTWTKYEYTFTGINGKIDLSIGFRYYVPAGYAAKGIGIDQFQFRVN
jgi:hypothetical protein